MQNLTKWHAQTQKVAIGSPDHNGIKENVGIPLLRVPLKHLRGYVWCQKAKKNDFFYLHQKTVIIITAIYSIKNAAQKTKKN